MAEGATAIALPRPELGEIVMRHDAVLGDEPGVPVDHGLHVAGKAPRLIALARGHGQQDPPPEQERRELGRHAAQRGDDLPRLGGTAGLQQGQRALQHPMTSDPRLCRRLHRVEQCQGFGRTLLLQ
jgi:hypothetical protein